MRLFDDSFQGRPTVSHQTHILCSSRPRSWSLAQIIMVISVVVSEKSTRAPHRASEDGHHDNNLRRWGWIYYNLSQLLYHDNATLCRPMQYEQPRRDLSPFRHIYLWFLYGQTPCYSPFKFVGTPPLTIRQHAGLSLFGRN